MTNYINRKVMQVTNTPLTFLCDCLVTGCVMKVLSEVKGVESPASNGCTCIAAAGCNCKCPAGCNGTATIFWRGTPQGRYQEPGWCCISDCLIDETVTRSYFTPRCFTLLPRTTYISRCEFNLSFIQTNRHSNGIHED